MKKRIAGMCYLLAFTSASALPDCDPFADATVGGGTAYTVGGPLSGNNQNVTNDWQLVNTNATGTNPQPVIVSGNLIYPDLVVSSTGNSISRKPAR